MPWQRTVDVELPDGRQLRLNMEAHITEYRNGGRWEQDISSPRFTSAELDGEDLPVNQLKFCLDPPQLLDILWDAEPAWEYLTPGKR